MIPEGKVDRAALLLWTSCVKTPFRVSFLVVLGLVTLAAGGARADDLPRYPDKIGVSLEGLGDGARARALVDVAHTLRGWTKPGAGDAVAIDEHGWPLADAQTVLFDIRPYPAWNPPIDDPDAFQPDWSGTYKMSFQGQATVAATGDKGPQLQNQAYDAATNLTTADIVVPKGDGLLFASFTQTKRTPDSPAGSGITKLRVIRPGYAADSKALFTDEYLRALKPFAVLRFMDMLETNRTPGFYGDPGHHALNWADRHVPEDATQQPQGNKYGVAWEYVAELARLTGKDIWINIPIAATDDYVKNLAQLLKQQLPPTCNIYIEHSNEVWNFGFPQYIYNKMAAIDEVKGGHSNLNNDGAADSEVWTHRRHAKRLIEIGNAFRDAFGPEGASRIRPVYASWVISPGPHYEDVLAWVEKTYGPPRNYFYGLAGAAYFNGEKAGPNADVPALLKALRANSDDDVAYRAALQKIADHYGIKNCQYEGGPDVGGGKTENVANRIRALRDPAIKDLILHDARDNWFAHGGDIYIYYDLCAGYSRSGCFGLSEDIVNLKTPQWQAIYELTGAPAP